VPLLRDTFRRPKRQEVEVGRGEEGLVRRTEGGREQEKRGDAHLFEGEPFGLWHEEVYVDVTESEHAEEDEQDERADAARARLMVRTQG
jgi:hypothetical protein